MRIFRKIIALFTKRGEKKRKQRDASLYPMF